LKKANESSTVTVTDRSVRTTAGEADHA